MVMELSKMQKALKPISMFHVFPSFGYGGQQTRFAALVKGLGARFRHHVLSLNNDAAARDLIDADAAVTYEIYDAKKSSLVSLANITRFKKEIIKAAPQLFCTYNWGAIEAVIANRLGANAPHLHFEDGFGPGEKGGVREPGRRALSRRLLLAKSTVIVPSMALKNIAEKQWNLKAESIRYIPNGVDFDRMQSAKPRLSATVQIGTVGALRPEKNHMRLIKALAVADRTGRASLTIIGDGPERDRLTALIKELKLEARVTLPGATVTPEKAYSQFDVFALPSDTEQAPLSLMEAMAAGLPVAATNVGDVSEMVAVENQPYIINANDDEAFSNALAQLIQNPTARAQLGAANRRKAKAEFSLESMIEAHKALYLLTSAA